MNLFSVLHESLGDLILAKPQYGANTRAIPMMDDKQVKYIRITDFGDDGISDNHEFTTPEQIDDKYLLQQNDILFARSGATAGKTLIYNADIGVAIFAGYCIRFQIDENKTIPQYIYEFTKTSFYKSWMQTTQRPSGQPNINAEEFSNLLIPLPPLDIQRALVADLDQARTALKTKLAEADELLKGMDEAVMRELGLKMPATPEPSMAFSVRLVDMMKNNRFNANYFHPERTTILQAIHQQYQYKSKSLGDIVKFMRDVVTVTENDSYMGLASVQSHTGERVLVDEIAEGQAFQFQTGDVLYGRLRPYLNKVYHAESEGLCSTEFHVMRVLDENIVISAYLATLLRTKVILNQTKHMMSGNTHPRLTNDDVINLLIPIPPTDIQQRIVDEWHRRRDRARQLRKEAEALWHEAQLRFEQALIG